MRKCHRFVNCQQGYRPSLKLTLPEAGAYWVIRGRSKEDADEYVGHSIFVVEYYNGSDGRYCKLPRLCEMRTI